MGIYLGILNGAADPAVPVVLTERQQADFLAAWARWAQDAGPALLDPGRPLLRKRRVTVDGVEDVVDPRVAYMVLRAESHDLAIQIARRHPHLSLTAGNSIDVIECPDAP